MTWPTEKIHGQPHTGSFVALGPQRLQLSVSDSRLRRAVQNAPSSSGMQRTQCFVPHAKHNAEQMMRMADPAVPDSSGEEGLDLGIQRLLLCCLAAHWTEASNLQLLPRLPAGVGPLLQRTLRKCLLSSCRCGLAYNLATFASRQCIFRQAAYCLLLGAFPDDGASHLSPSNDTAALHSLGLHGLHGLHGFHGFHGFHGCLHGGLHAHSLHSNLHRTLHSAAGWQGHDSQEQARVEWMANSLGQGSL